ncbi:MAG: protein kinase [Gemmatimonadota bacterium]
MIGTTLAHYRITAALGAGGMGEVYRATDTKLGREVALKVLPARLAESGEALERLEREARAVAALSHPNILAIHDFGSHEGTAYAVMELLEGQTLRERLATGAFPARKAVDIAVQVARGLAAAHEKGIIHRDLKPENIIVTPDGRAKILDFGLARQVVAPAAGGDTRSPTLAHATDAGTVLGTVGYMSPEQVRGETSDHRSDIFSLGSVLYEMLTGRRAFEKPTGAETMTAILREDPLEVPDVEVLPALERSLHHCLEKAPAERFQSARDLAFDLETAIDGSGRWSSRPGGTRSASRKVLLSVGLGMTAAGLVAGLFAGLFLGSRSDRAGRTGTEPTFTRLTFDQGTVWNARFTPDGGTVVYAAAWNGEPIRLFLTRLDTPQSTPLSLPDASLLSISPTGELAVSLGHTYEGWMGEGTLARTPLLGGGARQVLEGVREADWTPDGSQLAIVRRVEGRERLELPAGRVLYETAGYISHMRVSPRGDRIAFADHPLWADNFGAIAVVDLSGEMKVLTGNWAGGVNGLAWAPSGDEIWFTASDDEDHLACRAVDLEGRQRLLLAGPMDVVIFDVSREGHLLLGRETPRRTVEALMKGHSTPEDFSLREKSAARFVTPDGRAILISEQGADPYSTYLRRADGSPPVRLGDGDAQAISPDENWVVAFTGDTPPRILLHPTGPGESREVPNTQRIRIDSVGWLPGGGKLVVFGAAPNERSRGWVVDVDDGAARAFTEEGVGVVWLAPIASPDGSRVIGYDAGGRPGIFPLDGGPAQEISGVTENDRVVQWAEDGRTVFLGRREGPTWKVRRLDLETGSSTHWADIAPRETAGLRLSVLYLTPNGRFWAHSYSRLLTDLYVAEGIQ